MLRVIQTKSAAGAKSYYTQSDYLSEGQELVGKWGGKASKLLGLAGEVDKQSFDRLCDNLDPRSGNRLTLRTDGDRTVGYDFNFHVPKGVSLAYTLNQDERILGVFRESVEETMREIEIDAATRVRKHGMQEERQTGNLAWATYVHKTSRPVDGEPDPHLHAHCFVFNTTFDSVEKVWKAGQFRELKRDAPYYEAAFHARLAQKMSGLGYGIERKGRTWDIAGLEKATLDKFSRRTIEIEKLADKLDIEDDRAKDQLGAKTRAKKVKTIPMKVLVDRWKSRLDANDRKALETLTTPSTNEIAIVAQESREAEAVAYAKLHCFERDSVVAKRKLLGEALRQGVGEVSVEGIHSQLNQQGVICRQMHGREWVTTPEVLAEEGFMLQGAREAKGASTPLNATWEIRKGWLNTGQKDAVRHVLSSKDGVIMTRGGAGTGKTSLMQEAIEGIKSGGKQVLTFAPSAQASRGVLAKEGFDATTVAELLISEKLQQEAHGNVIWIDEAGLLGTRTLKQVMDVAKRADARLILSGDWKQHGAVERGAAMRLLEQEAGLVPAVVRKIERQDGEYREAVALLAEGQTRMGFDALNKLGWIHEIVDPAERYGVMAKSFANGWESGESVLAIAPTHAEAELLTERIRSELVDRGHVDKELFEFEQLKPLRLTEAEKTDASRVADGDVMVFHRAARGIKKGTRLEATVESAREYKKQADRFELYNRRIVKLARGDLVRITSNGKTKDGKHALYNGNSYRISKFNDRGDIVLENGWIVDRNYGFLTPGYVSTSHSAQGKTEDRVLIAESTMSYAAVDQAQFYVSVSRGRSRAEIFTDSKDALLDAVQKEDLRVSATELVKSTEPPRIIRHQRQQGKQDVERSKQLEYAHERG